MNAPLTHHPAPVREYRDAARLIADARELKRRMWAPTGIVDRAEPAPAADPPETYSIPDRRPQSLAMREMTKGFWCPSMPPKAIIRALAHTSGECAAEVLSESRRSKVALARQRAMVILAMAKPAMSVISMAHAWGRDHTTLLHAFKKLGYKHGRSMGHPIRRLDEEARS